MKRYLKFDGRSTRSQYWGVYLISLLLFLVGIIFGVSLMNLFKDESLYSVIGYFLGIAVCLTTVVIYYWVMIATTYRRCKDAGINTNFTWLILIPYINFIAVIIFGCISTDNSEPAKY